MLFNTNLKLQIEVTNLANNKTAQEILLLNTIPKKLPVKVYNYKNDDINSGEVESFNLPIKYNNDISYIDVGMKIDKNLITDVNFTAQANPIDYAEMEYDTNNNFINPYKRKVLHKKTLEK